MTIEEYVAERINKKAENIIILGIDGVESWECDTCGGDDFSCTIRYEILDQPAAEHGFESWLMRLS